MNCADEYRKNIAEDQRDSLSQVYEETRNDMTPRGVGGIALKPKKDRG